MTDFAKVMQDLQDELGTVGVADCSGVVREFADEVRQAVNQGARHVRAVEVLGENMLLVSTREVTDDGARLWVNAYEADWDEEIDEPTP